MVNWFKRTKSTQPTPQSKPLPTGPVVYPVGSCVITSKGAYWLKDGKRFRIPTKRILDSWNYPLIIHTSEAALKNYPISVSKVGFRDGSLLNNIADGKLYLVSEGKLHQITNPDVFERFGINHLMATVVSDAEINLMKQGEPFN